MTSWLLLCLPWLPGLLLARCLGYSLRRDPLACLPIAWLAACLLLGAGVQLALLLGLPPAWWGLLPIATSLLVVRWALRAQPAAAQVPPSGRAYAAFVWLGTGLLLLWALAGADRPCIEGDEGNIWSLKAKSLLVDFPQQFAAAQVHNLHPDYPQLNPLLQAYAYAVFGGVDGVWFANRVLVQLTTAMLWLGLAAALRRLLPAFAAALLASLLLLEPEYQQLLRTAYADGMVALGVMVAADAYLRWSRRPVPGDAWLIGMGLSFALWSKNETMLYCAAIVAAALVGAACRRWRAAAAAIAGAARPAKGWLWQVALLPALVVVGTFVWNKSFALQSDLLGANPTGKSMFRLLWEQWPERVPAMAQEAFRIAIDTAHAHVVLPLVLVVGLLRLRLRPLPGLWLLLLTLLFSWLGLHVVYVGSFLPLRFHLDTSYARVTFQLLPVALLLLAAALQPLAEQPAGADTARHA